MRRQGLFTGAAMTAMIGAAGGAAAQDAFDLGVIVVSGALTPQEITRTGATVEVAESDFLDTGGTMLAQALDRLPGVTVSANGGVGASTAVRVRGLDGRYLAVRLDGIDISDPSSTQTQLDFAGFLPAGLGRVEIVKGSQSALYGSEAIGGVIDITTAGSTEPGTSGEAALEFGSFGTRMARAGMSTRSERGGLAFNVSRIVTDGISAGAGDAERDGFDQTMATLSGDIAVTDAVTLGFSAFRRDAEVEIDRFLPFDNTGVNRTDQRGGRLYAAVDALGMDHEFSVADYSSERRDPMGFITRFDGDRRTWSYLGTAGIGAATVSFGAERTEEEYVSDFDAGETVTDSALAEVLLRPADTVDLTMSLRYDDDDDFGSHVSGRLAMAWQVTPDTTLRAVAGTGYRAPSLFERFSAYGDSGLAVEESRSFELGVEHRYGPDAFVKLTAFRTEIDDLIDFDFAATACGSGFGCYAQVPGETVSQGFELSGRYRVSDRIAVYGNYTRTDAETEGERLARVPRHDLTLGVDADLSDRLSAAFDTRLVRDVEPSPFAPADNLVGDYEVANLSLSYDLSDRATAYIRGENILDEIYQTAGGFNMPGRAVFVGIRAGF